MTKYYISDDIKILGLTVLLKASNGESIRCMHMYTIFLLVERDWDFLSEIEDFEG